MKGIFIPEITVEMFRDGCLESIETLMTEGEVYDIEYDPKTAQPERKKGKWIHNDSWVNTCSECGMGWNRAFLSDQWNFCPNCGSYNGGE